MSDEPLPRFAPTAPRLLPDHPVRLALLDLLAEHGTLTATEAARHLGHSSGLCSFHLRQLARYGLIEEAPHAGGRAKPWRLRWEDTGDDGTTPASDGPGAEFATLTRALENESYDRWLEHRERAPLEWRGREDEAVSAVVYLTPSEAAELARSFEERLRAYAVRDASPSRRPRDAVAVAAIARVFPLLTPPHDRE
ncbi:ArsR/SmtB family transcription factor [Streptomyces montanisoli]|uniref:Helix-turn-helix transcriptional regulator n=1 Tax=Streptomyces montanisoli TaxID=2798581 RepID=A0A940MAT1_9ACTN|nr:helix-turn-helix domain-containing protein [Streptomyces montanisoli]MBP0456620.1 helix-turn-helix transcriptional regulator [Streptomyces montanisoli]